MTTLRAEEALPEGGFSPEHYKAIHKHLFQDVYSWAGRYRTVRTFKEDAPFCFPENIEHNMAKLFERLGTPLFSAGVPFETFAGAAADFLADLNAIHPFREGNGRTQLAFLHLLGIRCDCPLDLRKVKRASMLAAMITSFKVDCAPLRAVILELRA